jgi:branched-chain amino acid transport system permease protein
MKPLVKNGIAYLVILIALLFVPRLISLHNLMLFEYGLAFAIVGLGFNLLLGYTGLLSFGHGAYFAAGAYTVAMISRYLPDWYRLEILIPAALFFSLVIALLFGFLCVRHTKVFFSILAMSLSMVLFALLFKLYSLTGGSDGVRVPIPAMLGFDFAGVRRPQFLQETYYYFLLLMFAPFSLVFTDQIRTKTVDADLCHSSSSSRRPERQCASFRSSCLL